MYGYWKAHQIGGKLEWRELFEPAIKLCEDGYIVRKSLANAIAEKESLIRKNSGLREAFINAETNLTLKAGDLARRTKLGRTLRILAENGYQAFYNGILTPTIVDEINTNGTTYLFFCYIIKLRIVNIIISNIFSFNKKEEM